MGLFDFGNEDMINSMSGTSMPQYQPVDLDQGTKGLIQGSIERARQPYQSTDIDKNASFFKAGAPTSGQAQSGLLSSPGTGQAIANKYSQLAGEKITALKHEQGRTDKEHEFARAGLAFNNAMKQQEVQNQNYHAYLEQIKNEQQVRAQTMNMMLGGIAQIGGAAAGGAGGGGGGGKGSKPSKGMNGNGNGGMMNSSYGGEGYGDYGNIG